MSDIAIRFDGLLLAASFVAAALLYAVVALAAWIASLGRNRHRQRLVLVARAAATMGLASLAGLGVVAIYLAWATPPAAGPDRIDWLALPVMLLFLTGCVWLVRCKPAATSQP